MDWETFHHPDWSLPVVKRRLSEEWIDLLSGVGDVLASNGRSLAWNKTYPSQAAYYSVMSRLRKVGLVVRHDDEGNLRRRVARASRPTIAPISFGTPAGTGSGTH